MGRTTLDITAESPRGGGPDRDPVPPPILQTIPMPSFTFGVGSRLSAETHPDQPETVKVAVVQPIDMTMLSLYDSPQGQGDDGWNRPTYRGRMADDH